MPSSLKKTVIFFAGIGLLAGSVICQFAYAESKSEIIKRLRNKNCTDDVTRTRAQLTRFEQLQLDVDGLIKAAQSNAPSIATTAKQATTPLSELNAALSSHAQSKQAICQRLKPQQGIDTSDYPDGYEGLSKSERIRRLKNDYCNDVKTNGTRIRQAAPLLTEKMATLLTDLKKQKIDQAKAVQVSNSWDQLSVVLDKINNEQMLANKICTGMSEGISKSELVGISRQGLEKGGQLPHFWYILRFD